MRPCYLFFSTSKDAISSVIRNVGDGRVSHAGLIYWSDEVSAWMTLEALADGWIIQSYYQFKAKGSTIVSLYSFPGHDLWNGVRRNRDIIGIPYDWTGALVGRGVIKWWNALTGQNIQNHWQSKARFYCNEIIAARVLPCAEPPIDIGPRADMDPYELETLVITHGARAENVDILSK